MSFRTKRSGVRNLEYCAVWTMFDIGSRFLAALGMTCTVNSSEWKADSVNELINTYRNDIRKPVAIFISSCGLHREMVVPAKAGIYLHAVPQFVTAPGSA